MEEVTTHPSLEASDSKPQPQQTTLFAPLPPAPPLDQKQIKQSVQPVEPHNMHKNDQEQESQFLHLDDAIKKKLDAIDNHKNIQEVPPDDTKKINLLKKTKQQSLINLSLSPKHQSLQPANPSKRSVETDPISETEIKRQFVHKLKEWSKQRQEIEHKKQQIHARNLRQKQEEQQRRRKDKEAEIQFQKLEKKKQLEHKINEIEERRKQREQSLKNAVLKRSYNGVPKYLEYQHKFQEKEEEKAIIDLKIIKNKKAKQSMDPEQLRAHQKAYIERIKERLNMKVHQNKDESQKRRTKSDFNLYLNKSEQLKKAELQKIIRRKKFQEKISKIPIKINEEKKQEVLISIDKSKNPHKYNLLSQKSLNDKQIYQEFRDFDIDIDRKELGKNYLRELKNSPKKGLRAKAQSQMLIKQVEVESKRQFPKLVADKPPMLTKQGNKSSSTFIQSSKSYENSLKKAKERDSRYMNALKEKLAMVI